MTDKGGLVIVDGKAQCGICKRAYGHLGAHIKRRHGLEADEYRERFGLNRQTGLIGPDLAEKRRATRAQLQSLRGSTPETNAARGKRRPYRLEAAMNRDWVRDPVSGRYVG